MGAFGRSRDPCLPWRGILGPGHTPRCPEAALGAEAPGPSPRPFLPNSTEHPMPWLSKLSQSCRPALPTRAWARCCDPSQAGVGLHSTSPQGPRASRWQLCGQLNGSSVPFLALHLLQEASALTLGGGAQKSHGFPRDAGWSGSSTRGLDHASSLEMKQQEGRG